MRPEEFSHFIHPQSKTLFTFGDSNGTFGAFNLETEEMKHDHDNLLRKYGQLLTTWYIQGGNELHIIEDEECEMHNIFKFDENNDMHLVCRDQVQFCHSSELLYILTEEKLIMIQWGTSFKMLEYNLNQSTEWKIMDEIKMTHVDNGYKFIQPLIFYHLHII